MSVRLGRVVESNVSKTQQLFFYVLFCRTQAAATWPKVLPSLCGASTVCFWLLRRRLGTASELNAIPLSSLQPHTENRRGAVWGIMLAEDTGNGANSEYVRRRPGPSVNGRARSELVPLPEPRYLHI
jgi:hypothetical protein